MPDALNNAGTICTNRKNMGKRFAPIVRLSRSNADFAPFYLNLGFAYFNEKEYEDSIRPSQALRSILRRSTREVAYRNS